MLGEACGTHSAVSHMKQFKPPHVALPIPPYVAKSNKKNGQAPRHWSSDCSFSLSITGQCTWFLEYRGGSSYINGRSS